ncbi:16S rRNA (adenine(1518)-N(6)/adenine(1519)-N(6))-dimethyltransferase RsmA [bacterium endosymbiont of Bathymodiolus sp. 5 South]|jgi:16S rRNA (adenine1518-N6/adenine1519-N6)-dimethyltransferase|uniref:16S rRNA (adenine(1518)-N(6)/adenine(1519)-N(6))- dimethyltransferase RsmA n=1 Tax=bacterium endosymbiont of Bathymodiolus sp. 5 South TaxID=1181670 RepID=UPI0010B5C7B6|nr:16S rRNA (adenine(1518)-N(6)/adenine(1519)-N(6))-dimethyltransferase RsmA [bacterium endosymbiont of Bathymodiolus sp. 5 South]CAC9441559.1 SSU rRNA (adenine(1518)-N(6)/adenine(1519)-N(6))-dimethyltransferase (EC 2.1.1.182) [uncultured Gammaproteobacteria bacterium]SHN90015.1 SSU rRNA (adenine(1518)-N(6)/adenine(1519)-N(6))-dimethyltransferase [bacterium endosymbiont of Bathymodiolus sp. 5 South]SSC08439.1 SSU rRNA (adenine(1518)-N(6)/adenine(1519)-N(6))-dimethyltransferase [bacterium endosym
MSKHKARKRFGQNFLTDNRVIERIVATIAPKFNDNLLEIGPGQGAMTLPLLECVKQLNVIEIDKDLIVMLRNLNKDNLIIHQGDALKFDLSTLTTPLRVVGNLPYNISSPLLFHLLENRDKVVDMTFMLQKEVVERMVAENGSKTYGRLSVMIQAFFEVELVFIVPPESFEPAPKVDSAIVYLKPLTPSKVSNTELFEKIVKAAFSQRRKTLGNCLKSLLLQNQTTIDLSQRAEMLKVEDFIVLTNEYEATYTY